MHLWRTLEIILHLCLDSIGRQPVIKDMLNKLQRFVEISLENSFSRYGGYSVWAISLCCVQMVKGLLDFVDLNIRYDLLSFRCHVQV
jgi:hypothetical protein